MLPRCRLRRVSRCCWRAERNFTSITEPQLVLCSREKRGWEGWDASRVSDQHGQKYLGKPYKAGGAESGFASQTVALLEPVLGQLRSKWI